MRTFLEKVKNLNCDINILANLKYAAYIKNLNRQPEMEKLGAILRNRPILLSELQKMPSSQKRNFVKNISEGDLIPVIGSPVKEGEESTVEFMLGSAKDRFSSCFIPGQLYNVAVKTLKSNIKPEYASQLDMKQKVYENKDNRIILPISYFNSHAGPHTIAQQFLFDNPREAGIIPGSLEWWQKVRNWNRRVNAITDSNSKGLISARDLPTSQVLRLKGNNDINMALLSGNNIKDLYMTSDLRATSSYSPYNNGITRESFHNMGIDPTSLQFMALDPLVIPYDDANIDNINKLIIRLKTRGLI